LKISIKNVTIMAVPYVVIPRNNPGKPDAPKKFYAKAKSALKRLSKEICEGNSTVSDTDTLAVLNELTKVLRRNLSQGKIVRLGDFGCLQVAVSSDGAETEERFNQSLIRRAKVNFRPGAELRNMLATLKYTKTK